MASLAKYWGGAGPPGPPGSTPLFIITNIIVIIEDNRFIGQPAEVGYTAVPRLSSD